MEKASQASVSGALSEASHFAESMPPRVRADAADPASKRAMDVVIAASSLLILAPFLPLIALLLKLDSPGPVFHRRRVLGRGKRPFDAYKFRTMYVNGDAILAAHPELSAQLQREGKLKDDPRVTSVGAWLRRSSIDELPQLVNVLRGEMSMVGPRMISPAELERFGPYAEELLTVRPGITGLWQVSGRADLPYQDRVLLNIRYIRTRTLWMDVRLLLMTIPAVFARKGAY